MIAARCQEHNQIGCWCLSDNIFSTSLGKGKISEFDWDKYVVLTEEEIKKIPNDMELGRYVREKLNEKTKL